VIPDHLVKGALKIELSLIPSKLLTRGFILVNWRYIGRLWTLDVFFICCKFHFCAMPAQFSFVDLRALDFVSRIRFSPIFSI